MTSDKGKAFWLGIFVIIAISTVAWLFLFLKPTVGDGKTTLKIRFTNVEGITIGTRVSFGGKPVGTVTSIKEIPNAREEKPDPFGNYYFYEVTAKVDSKVRIYSYDQIALSTQGLLGEKLIEITPRATPIGAKPAVNITADVLFARSGDQIQSAIEDFSHLLGKVTSFLDQNMPLLKESMENINSAAEDFHELIEQAMDSQVVTKAASAASSVDSAMQKACSVLDEVKDNQLPARIAGAATTVEEAAGKIVNGKGTISRLINSDGFYLQLQATVCKLETVLSDVSNYGLLFQYDRKWQRKRTAKVKQMEELQSPEDFSKYMSGELCEISTALDRVSEALKYSNPENDPCFNESYRELLGRLEHLLGTLKNYNETLRRCE